ncbi:MAG: SycD/LcrH family type III secretion system chaperone [Simkaniaceae bacterium]|nr:SycD/LcrH family type III secretion system chaperone [Candidatus Sacchlamyda saccharinae]
MRFVDTVAEFKEELGVKGGTVFSQKDLETIYSIAFGKYDLAEYQQAAELFTHLLLHDPYDIRFWKGLASSEQMQKNYKAALHAWAVHSLLSGHDPDGHFHAAECYLSLGEKEEAKRALKIAEKFVSGTHQRLERLKEHIDG